jgi:hypothetical protein
VLDFEDFAADLKSANPWRSIKSVLNRAKTAKGLHRHALQQREKME